ncbi:hypothetical protein MNBD_GAMMA12-43 [hydrothermal vent metagenome]|uniref:Uncharacterized protein n=1 Tax=hydrothermal vent metagenome TaxID=652676 RepID=A0A3B0YLH2_9ZZZZ
MGDNRNKIALLIILVLLGWNIVNWIVSDDSKDNESIISNHPFGDLSAELGVMVDVSKIITPGERYKIPVRDIFESENKKVVELVKPVQLKTVSKKKAPTALQLRKTQIKVKINKFKLVGIARRKAVLNAFLLFDDQDITVIIGDLVFDEFKILEITDKQVKIRHIKTKIEKTVVIGK